MKNCTVDLSDRLPLPNKKQTSNEKRRQTQADKVKSAFKKKGYTLLSEYKGSREPLDYVCAKGHKTSAQWSAIKDNVRCGICTGSVRSKESAVKIYESCGYTVLGEYVNTSTPVLVRCRNGHEREVSFGTVRLGRGCLLCSKKYIDPKTVVKAFQDAGYEVLGKYINDSTKIDVKCPQGHSISQSWASFRLGNRCIVCAGQVVTHDQVQDAFEAAHYTLLSAYKRCHQRLLYICDRGHERRIAWSSFRSGQRCAVCAGQVITHDHVKNSFDIEGYTLLSTYKNSKSYLEYICPQKHHHKIQWTAWSSGQRCAYCSDTGYKSDLPGTLYYARFTLLSGAYIYKIGITNLTVKKRFAGETIPYEIIWQQRFEDGKIAKQMEREILRKHKKHKYKGYELKSGNTECFTRDVLGYDKDVAQLSLIVS